MRPLYVLALVAGCGGRAAAPTPEPAPAFDPQPVLIAGTLEPDRAPDGNSVVLDAPGGLIVVDTGRHPAHQEKLLAHARAAGKPIVAIVNTHWHLDHSGGNAEIRAVYPEAEIITTTAIEGALVDFLAKGKKRREELLASGQVSPEQREDMMLDGAAVDAPEYLRPTRAIETSGIVEIAGRRLDVRVAPYAATAADLWIYDEATRTVIAGDLVVPIVPFLDTACAAGWQRALGEIAATPFERLIPGHGDPMTPEELATWRRAFDALIECAASPRDAEECVEGWGRDAMDFIPVSRQAEVDEAVRYYLDVELRSVDAQRLQCGGE